MRTLGIETSCDETAVCLIEATGEFGPDFTFKVLGNALASQAALHARYGGVFPNLAKREHARNLVPLLEQALGEARLLEPGKTNAPKDIEHLLAREQGLFGRMVEHFSAYRKPAVDAIAVTHGPGLEPALWVGVNFARALSSTWDIPVVGVNHLEGHIVMSMMKGEQLAGFEFPVLALLISGGNTQLVLSKKFGTYEVVGKTRDDAAGEAFDKVARMLKLPYPGGPHVSKLAKAARAEALPAGAKLPRPMLNEDNLDFSFSGLKTAVLRIVKANSPLPDELKKQLSREFEEAVSDVLAGKTLKAVEEYGVNTVITGGGVSANIYIRGRLAEALEKEGAQLLVCPSQLSTDNAIMIALAGYFHALKRDFADPATLFAKGNLKLA